MKVLHLDTSAEWRAGPQQVLYLTRGLEERGIVSVVVTTPGGALARRLRRQDLPLLELPLTSGFSPRTVRSLQQVLADRHWHILHAHTAHAHTLAFLTYRLPPPRPFHRPALVVTRRVGIPPSRDPLTRLKYTAAGQTVICVSDAVSGVLQQYGVPPATLRVVRSGVPIPGQADPSDPLPSEIAPAAREVERRELRGELGVPADALLVGNISPLAEGKGHRDLLEAWAVVADAVPRAHLVLLGRGELDRDLRRRTDELGVGGSTTFAGGHSNPARYLETIDLLAHASIEEGLGTPILDALAAGVPVVATRTGGIPETMNDGVTGLLVPPASAEALARAVIDLLEDHPRREAMGRAGRDWVIERFSTDRMVDETLAIYRDVLSRGV